MPGLGSGASVSLDLNPEIANLQTWQANINAATGTMDVAQTAMTQIQQIASNLFSQLDGLQGTDGSEVGLIAASAHNALSQVANLLDTTDGTTYVFGGADSSNPPVPDPDDITSSAGFYTQIAAAVGNLGTAGANATAAATLTIASSMPPARLRSPPTCRSRPRHSRRSSRGADRAGTDHCRRPARQCQQRRPIGRQLDHRLVYERSDARAGHGRLADQRPAERSGIPGPGAGHA